MKKINFVLSIGMTACLLLLNGCTKKKEEEMKKEYQTSYDVVYNGTSNKKHDIVLNSTEVNRASYGYKFNATQGYNNWYFLKRNGNNDRSLICENDVWSLDGTSLNDGVISTKGGDQFAYAYKCQSAGLHSFDGTLKSANEKGQGGSLSIYKNSTKIYPQNGEISVNPDDLVGKYINSSVDLLGSDTLYFVIEGDDVYFNPSIVKGNKIAYSLYDTHNPWGAYGDIHCYYYKGIFHMYNLWNHNGEWIWHMQDTTDMFRFVDNGYDDSFVQNHYMKYGNCPNVFTEEYIDSRDRTYFFDEQCNVYREIGLCYKENGVNVNCDLALRTSDDELGFEWSQKCVAMRSFPTTADGEPECSQLFRMGDRWYLCTGISKQPGSHGVGGLSYWFGGKGQTIDQVDWKNLPTNRLDGDDLCVPQIEKLGDRFYMFGWMPSSFNSGCWGGPKNLAREVYQNEDGTLGSKIDERATALLNKGRLFEISDENISNKTNAFLENGQLVFTHAGQVDFNQTIGSSFNKYSIDFQEANNVELVINSQNDQIHISVYKDDFGLNTRVYDQFGFESSKLLITSKNVDEVDIKTLVENGTVEVCVGDIKVLSARTRQSHIGYTPSFVVDGKCIIKNISFNRMAQYYDIFD